MIGVIGGMGPLATSDFFAKVLAATAAANEEDHVPLLIQSDPRIPSRPDAMLRGGASPLPALLAARDRLLAAGASALAMPCNTAHCWYPQLTEGCPVPFISILQSCCDEVAGRVPPAAKVGNIATGATLRAQCIDSTAALARGLRWLVANAGAVKPMMPSTNFSEAMWALPTGGGSAWESQTGYLGVWPGRHAASVARFLATG